MGANKAFMSGRSEEPFVHISKLKIRSLKCFRDSGEVTIRPGLNVLVGANNSGKSALLQSIRLLSNIVLEKSPHQFQYRFRHEYRNKAEPKTRAEICFTLTLTESAQKTNPTDSGTPSDRTGADSLSHQDIREIEVLIDDMWDRGDPYGMRIESVIATDMEGKRLELASFQNMEPKNYGYRIVNGVLVPTQEYTNIEQHPSGLFFPRSEFFPFDVIHQVKKGIFYVSPHRIAPRSLVLNYQDSLTIDENNQSNLHQVLHTLYSNEPEIFQEIQEVVCRAFVDVARVETPVLTEPSNHTAIHLVPTNTGLKIPLAESGTGIEQFLTIAAVAIGSRKPRVILIDEPHAFLHPKAEKELLALFEEYPQHQYFVATHSPIWINRADWGSLHWIQRQRGESTARPVLTNETKALEPIFRDLGVENSDWTSTDAMIFVEGPSDKVLYRRLLQKIGYEKSLTNVVFVPIGGTGTIRSRQRDFFFRLCSMILEGVSKLPISYFCVFDRHEKDDQEITKLQERHREKVKLLSRYEIENFLLEPSAICKAIREEVETYCKDQTEKERIVSNLQPSIIGDMFEDKKNNPKFYPDRHPDPESWEVCIRGSSLMDEIYARWQVPYQKTTSGPRIVKYLSEQHTSSIREELRSTFEFLPIDESMTKPQPKR